MTEKSLRLIFITTCRDEEFFLPVRKGMRDAAEMLGVRCEFTGTEGVDIPAQMAMVRQAVAQRYDGIALNIIDAAAFDEVVQEAADAGVPVVAFNVDANRSSNARLAAVCQQFHEAGLALGHRAAEFIAPGSQVLFTMHDEGISALEQRLAGIQDALIEKQVVSHAVVTGADPEKAAEVVAHTLAEHPGIGAVLATGQADTEGAGLAVERQFAYRGIAVVGFDLSPNILRLIKAGYIRFTVDQQPYIQGFYPVVQLVLYCRYGIMPSNIDTGAAMIDRQNVDTVIKLSELQYR